MVEMVGEDGAGQQQLRSFFLLESRIDLQEQALLHRARPNTRRLERLNIFREHANHILLGDTDIFLNQKLIHDRAGTVFRILTILKKSLIGEGADDEDGDAPVGVGERQLTQLRNQIFAERGGSHHRFFILEVAVVVAGCVVPAGFPIVGIGIVGIVVVRAGAEVHRLLVRHLLRLIVPLFRFAFALKTFFGFFIGNDLESRIGLYCLLNLLF